MGSARILAVLLGFAIGCGSDGSPESTSGTGGAAGSGAVGGSTGATGGSATGGSAAGGAGGEPPTFDACLKAAAPANGAFQSAAAIVGDVLTVEGVQAGCDGSTTIVGTLGTESARIQTASGQALDFPPPPSESLGPL